MGKLYLTDENGDPTTPSTGIVAYPKSTGLFYKVAGGSVYGPLLAINGALINAQTGATYTTVDSDNGKVVTMNNGSANTLTIHAGAPAGFSICIIQLGAGQTTITASGGAVHNRQSQTAIADQYGVVSAIVVSNAGSAPSVLLAGDTA